jgi:ABC-type enterochelin transport system permease subunit
VVFGFPIHLLLRSKQQTRLRAYLSFAPVAAIAVMSALEFVSDVLFSDWAKDNPFTFTMWSRAGVVLSLIFVAVACLCASVFCAVAVKRPQA